MLHNRLIGQLDTLIPFLALSHEGIFRLLKEHRLTWFADNEDALPAAYASYRKQVNHSAFLLGYSYLESFLTDLIGSVLRQRPAMLPKSRKIDYSEVLDSRDKDALIDRIIQRELHDLFYKSMADIIEELRSRYGFTITEEEESRLVVASLVRNCIMHNSACADARLGVIDGFHDGEEFELSEEDVHDYGLILRRVARRMYAEAQANHGVGAGGG